MIVFPELRSKRLSIDMKEISILDASRVLAVEAGRSEAETTIFLESIINKDKSNFCDPRLWTVQERMLAVAHYQMHTSDDKDFLIGDKAHFSDYFSDIDYPEDNIKAGNAIGSDWTIVHLTGAMVEVIEQLKGSIEGVGGIFHWHLSMMSCQLRKKDDTVPDPATDTSNFIDWLIERIDSFAKLGESDYYKLLDMLIQGQAKLMHLFSVAVDESGLIAQPLTTGAEGETLPSARFPAISCISEITQTILGKPNK